MKSIDIIRDRLINQQIAESKFKKPQEIVTWMVAMQAQEYAMAKWAIGLRLKEANDAGVEEAFNNGSILRTHLMRPTWHFVSPKDIRWLLTLTAPRVNKASAFMYRQCELDIKIFNRSNDVLAKALEGSKYLTRNALKAALEKAKIPAVGFRLGYLLMRAELDGIICSGPREGKQFTYALFDERVPPSKYVNREEGLVELSRRYFQSRGPATVQDFVSWSGLTVKDAREGVANLGARFEYEIIDGREHIFIPTKTKTRKSEFQTTFLMPDYDEYGMSYKDRSAIFNPESTNAISRGNPVFNRMIIIDGRIEGTWRRIEKGKRVIIETLLFGQLKQSKHRAVIKAAKRYSIFIDKVLTK